MPTNIFDLTDEVAVVLGGTGVLGGAMAEALASAGARVAVAGRSEERGKECVRRIEAAGGRAMFVSADAMSKDSLATARDAVIKAWGSVTVLVNGAGGNKPDPAPAAEKAADTPTALRAPSTPAVPSQNAEPAAIPQFFPSVRGFASRAPSAIALRSRTRARA